MVTHSLCDSEARLIAKLLGEDVEQVGRMVDGAQMCEYLVRCEGDVGVPAGNGEYIALETLLKADVS